MTSLTNLLQQDDFHQRHIGFQGADRDAMLQVVVADSLNDLMDQAVPPSIRMSGELELPGPRTEAQALAELAEMAGKNQVLKSYIGMGYHDTITPSVILRNLLEHPGWYTAYTPYQAEISQGRLEMLLNFQQLIMDLTGMDVANASLLDEATAAAEAMTFCKRVSRSKSNRFFVTDDCHPQTLDVLKTRAEPLGLELVVGNPWDGCEDAYGVLLQYPGTFGDISSLGELSAQWQERGAMVAVAADLLSLVLLKPPGEFGADVVVGSAQRFGVPMGYGGPHAGFFATRDAHKRAMPGRLIGVSVDRRGKLALRMALQTREQHIRREKATSNICTAQVLLANVAAAYALYHGPEGLTTIAQRVHHLTYLLACGLRKAGLDTNATFFDTLTVNVPDANAAQQRSVAVGMNLRKIDSNRVGISFDEATTAEDVTRLLKVLCPDSTAPSIAELTQELEQAGLGIPQGMRRTSEFLTHPVFHEHRSETSMMRYLKRLEGKDIALDRAMIPLGSCTMKLNAATEMRPVTWPEFGRMHPFVPIEQATGYAELIGGLEDMLCQLTGFDAICMQPNSGAQGEYAGLLVIRKYHQSRGEGHREVCLIPSSAHGTNPASAAMQGMKVVIVKCDSDGNIDMADLRGKAEKHADRLAALMITYPSTHGVFEPTITEICEIIHQHGGQVYMDGANLNALVGIAQPGLYGADVSHMNLHKTFCIPHGGGGPGMGPIGMKAHLAPFMASHAVVPPPGTDPAQSAISAAPWGSPSVLPISWAYLRMMGGSGLKLATQSAILAANYLAQRLEGAFPVLYTGQNNRVAHECILDIRGIKESSGITEEDVAKRLIDYGFHAPTMSWPVPGTLMIEPTESEPKAELDRFCNAMLNIREEIAKVESGTWSREDNPLKNAPHTLDDLMDEWTHSYSKAEAVYPAPALKHNKYWSPVNRIDNVYGDRNVVCSCPPPEAYEDGVLEYEA